MACYDAAFPVRQDCDPPATRKTIRLRDGEAMSDGEQPRTIFQYH